MVAVYSHSCSMQERKKERKKEICTHFGEAGGAIWCTCGSPPFI